MTYLRSSIIIQTDGLYKASIFTSYFYFGEQEVHSSFKTVKECSEWLLSKRCTSLKVITELNGGVSIGEKLKDKKN